MAKKKKKNTFSTSTHRRKEEQSHQSYDSNDEDGGLTDDNRETTAAIPQQSEQKLHRIVLSLNSIANYPDCIKVSPTNNFLALVSTSRIFIHDLNTPTKEAVVIENIANQNHDDNPASVYRTAEWSPYSCPHLHQRQLLLTLNTCNQLILYSFIPATSFHQDRCKQEKDISELWYSKFKKKQRTSGSKQRDISSSSDPDKKQRIEELEFFRTNDNLHHIRAIEWCPTSFNATNNLNSCCSMRFVTGGKSNVTFWEVHFESNQTNNFMLQTKYAGSYRCHNNAYVTAVRWCSIPSITGANSTGVLFTGGADGSVQMAQLFAQERKAKSKVRIEVKLLRIILQKDLSFVSFISPLITNEEILLSISKSNQVMLHEYNRNRTSIINGNKETSSFLTGFGWADECSCITTDRTGNIMKWTRTDVESASWSCETIETSEQPIWGAVMLSLKLFLVYFQSSADSKCGKLVLLPLPSFPLPRLFLALGDKLESVTTKSYWEIIYYLRGNMDEYQSILSLLDDETHLLSMDRILEQCNFDECRDAKHLAHIRIGIVIRSQIGLLREKKELEKIERSMKVVQQYNILKKLDSYLQKIRQNILNPQDNVLSTSIMLCCQWLERSFDYSLPATIAKTIGDVLSLITNSQPSEVCCFCETRMEVTGSFPQETCANGHLQYRCAISMLLVDVLSSFTRCTNCSVHISSAFRNPAQFDCPICHSALPPSSS